MSMSEGTLMKILYNCIRCYALFGYESEFMMYMAAGTYKNQLSGFMTISCWLPAGGIVTMTS